MGVKRLRTPCGPQKQGSKVADVAHKFLVLVGEGANGKSVFTEVATQLIGPENVTHVGLERFSDRFALARTIGKLANIVSEVAQVRAVAEDILKAIVSGDRIQVEFKQQTPFDAQPTVRLIFATNETPRFIDRTNAIWRRILIVPFAVTIPEQRQDRKLAERICAGELPGIFNWATVGLKRLRTNRGFNVPKSTHKAIAEHRVASNPARAFLLANCEPAGGYEVRTQRLYTEYELWCSNNGYRPLNEQHFGLEVRRAYPTVERVQRRDGVARPYYYVGIRVLRPRLRLSKTR